MKIVKELPKSVYYSCFLRVCSYKKLIKNKKTVPVLVSLTSIPTRINTLDIVIKSVLNQSVLPEKIYLWLHHDLKDKLPKRLAKLQSDIFEIKYSDLTCSHRKLIHTLKENPTKNIITCDDDLIYRENWLENLYNEHLKHPNSVIANTTTQIKFDDNGNYLSFVKWRTVEKSHPKNSLLPIGAWGIFYPPKALNNEVFNADLFLKLTPRADDLWFKGMALLNNTNAIQANNKPKEPIPIIGSQKVALKKENVDKKGNDEQWLALSEHFKLDKILLNN